jgi:hypothetical protein
MRLTVMRQMAKGLSSLKPLAELETDLERVKWYLWHGNVFRALQVLDKIQFDLDTIEDESGEMEKVAKLAKAVREFHGSIEANQPFIPNDGERYATGRPSLRRSPNRRSMKSSASAW